MAGWRRRKKLESFDPSIYLVWELWMPLVLQEKEQIVTGNGNGSNSRYSRRQGEPRGIV